MEEFLKNGSEVAYSTLPIRKRTCKVILKEEFPGFAPIMAATDLLPAGINE